jgi:oxygen-dependent protoporphyrinogen oxidase
MRVAVLGGGIAGLSAALELEKARAIDGDLSYVLYEAGSRWGGAISSDRVQGCVVEGGPDSWLTEKPAAAKLCAELGLADELIASNDAERKTYIVVKQRLVQLPDGLMFMVPTKLVPTALSRLFSVRTKIKMALELMHPPRPASGDESVAALVERHFGAEVVDRLVDPLLAGIYGGDARSLSARAVLARMVEMEEKYGSLCRGMLAARARMAAAKSNQPRALFTTLRGGMQKMVDGIVARLPEANLRLDTRVRALDRGADRWRVSTDEDTAEFDAVIVATPAWAAGELLARVDAGLGAALGATPYSSSVTVNLGYAREDLRSLPQGFGFLVPASAGYRMLACTFVHNKFAGRVPEGQGILRCFLGGARGEAVLDLPDAEIERSVLEELRALVGLKATPRFVRVHRSRRGMAQYAVGHIENLARIDAAVSKLPGLALAGNAYSGIGVPDCIRLGQAAVAKVIEAGVREGASTRG